MSENQVQHDEIPIDHLPPKEYNEAREKGLTSVPQPVVEEPPAEDQKEEEKVEEKRPLSGAAAQKRIDPAF